MPKGKEIVELWKKRITSAQKLHETWDEGCRVKDCYNYWKGQQLIEEFDRFGNRYIQINKIHPEVRNNIPSLYYYRPFVRLSATPEQSNDSGTTVDQDVQILQDTVNYLIRDPLVEFRPSTFLGLKEAHWAFATVEVGYSADFTDTPTAIRPPLREKEDTKGIEAEADYRKSLKSPSPEMMPSIPPIMGEGMVPGMPPEGMPPEGMLAPPGEDLNAVVAEVESLQKQLRGERFYVKHIPARQILISDSDQPILENNDWVGYWEDIPLEDVKKAPAYENVKELEPCTSDDEKQERENNESVGATDKIRLYKIWDLRTKMKYVFAKNHDKVLQEKGFSRCPLKFLRFDVDPYHFYPRPLIFSKLGPQEEYNKSRQWLSDVRDGIVPRYTYDQDALEAKDMKKLESGKMGTYVPRKGGTVDPITPVNQPSYSENALKTLTLSDKEFQDVGGVGNDAKIAATKTATQAKIAEVKDQTQDSFDRTVVAEWLGEIAKELLVLAIENMSVDRWVAINVVPDGMMAQQTSQEVAGTFQRVNAEVLGDASKGMTWDVIIDIESMSPVSEEQQFQKWMQGLSLFGNPPMARLFAAAPPLLKRTLSLLGMKSATDQDMIVQAMAAVVQMEQQLAMAGQNAAPGMSPQGGSGAPGAPKPAPGPPPGGPQPGGPAGPGSSPPKVQ